MSGMMGPGLRMMGWLGLGYSTTQSYFYLIKANLIAFRMTARLRPMFPMATAIHNETNPTMARTANPPFTKIEAQMFCLTTRLVFRPSLTK